MNEKRDIPPPQQDISRKRLIWLVISFSLIMLSLVVIFVINKPGSIEGVKIYEQQVRGHDDAYTIVSSDLPPVGGVHHSEWQACGIYSEPVAPEQAVHSLEHGAVWITYRPDLAAGELADLEALAGDQDYLLLSPFPGQRSPIVLTAWGVQLEVESSEDERIGAFISRYRLGPTIPERGADC
jgi:hypothetical protein